MLLLNDHKILLRFCGGSSLIFHRNIQMLYVSVSQIYNYKVCLFKNVRTCSIVLSTNRHHWKDSLIGRYYNSVLNLRSTESSKNYSQNSAKAIRNNGCRNKYIQSRESTALNYDISNSIIKGKLKLFKLSKHYYFPLS